jgi:formylglycine-generating enzyme required for sulfatase activity
MTRISTFGTILLVLYVSAFPCQGGEDVNIPLAIETVLVPGATFTMGTPLKKDDERYSDNKRPLEVTVKDFRIGKYPITAEQMCVFLNSEEATKDDRETLFNVKDIGKFKYSTVELDAEGRYVPRKKAAKAPAMPVTWKGAVLYCTWLSEKIGRKFRLPSEAEWELAAGGKEKRNWPWGSDNPGAKMGPRYAYSQRSTKEVVIVGLIGAALPRTDAYWETVAVGGHPANATPEGVQDFLAYWMVEWCANKYVTHPTSEQATDIRVDLDDLRSKRAVRGHPKVSYKKKGVPWYLRVTGYDYSSCLGRPWTRTSMRPQEKDYGGLGFRVVEELAAEPQN